MLSLCRPGPVRPEENASREGIAPSFGTMFIWTPPVFRSADMPLVSTTTSWKLRLLKTKTAPPCSSLAHAVLHRDIVNRAAAVDPELRALVEAAHAMRAGLGSTPHQE